MNGEKRKKNKRQKENLSSNRVCDKTERTKNTGTDSSIKVDTERTLKKQKGTRQRRKNLKIGRAN